MIIKPGHFYVVKTPEYLFPIPELSSSRFSVENSIVFVLEKGIKPRNEESFSWYKVVCQHGVGFVPWYDDGRELEELVLQ